MAIIGGIPHFQTYPYFRDKLKHKKKTHLCTTEGFRVERQKGLLFLNEAQNPTWSATCWGSVVGKQHNFGRLSLNLTSMIVTHLSHHYCCPAFIYSRHIAIFSQSPKNINAKHDSMILYIGMYHWKLHIIFHEHSSYQPTLSNLSSHRGGCAICCSVVESHGCSNSSNYIHCFIHLVSPQRCHFQTGVLLFYLHPIYPSHMCI